MVVVDMIPAAALHVAVNEVLAAVHHPLLPFLPGKDLKSVLSFLRYLDVHQEVLGVLDAVPGVALLTLLQVQRLN
jgi:hypothetical protein